MHRIGAITTAALLTAVALHAVVPTAAAQDAPAKPIKLTGDFGYVSTAGNSDVQTLTSTEKLEYTTGKWLFTQDGAAVWGTDHGVENAGRYLLGLRTDYALTGHVGLYALGSWRRNTFAAISRQFDEGVGVVYHVLRPTPHEFDVEAGAGLSQRRTTLGDEENFGTGRLASLYRYHFREKAYLEGAGIYLANFKNSDDYEWDARAAVVAPLGGFFALKVGYNYHFRNAPPPGFRQWDSTFSSGIQVTY